MDGGGGHSAPFGRRTRGCLPRDGDVPAGQRHHVVYGRGVRFGPPCACTAIFSATEFSSRTSSQALSSAPSPQSRPLKPPRCLRNLRARFGDVPGLHLSTAKVFMDGVMEFPAQTAALLKPYLDSDGQPTDNYGDLYVNDTALWSAGHRTRPARLAGTCPRNRRPSRPHRPQRVRASLTDNGPSGNRHTIAHLQLVHPADYTRFGELGVIACMQLQWAVRNFWTLDALRPYIGESRFNRLYPAHSMASAGARLSGGSDWPVDPLSPFNQIATAVDRTTTDSSDPTPLEAAEGISRRHSLRMHTRSSAFQMHSPNTGTISVGKRADLIVLDRDITSGPIDEIRGTVVNHTLIRGQVVYDASSTTARRALRTMGALGSAAGAGAKSGPFGRHSCCAPKGAGS